MDVKDLVDKLLRSFPERKEPNFAVAFSGGLDSAVVTAAAQRRFGNHADIEPIVVGLSGAQDLEAATVAAKELDLSLRSVTLKGEDVLGSIPFVSRTIGTTDPVVISFTLPLFFVLKQDCPREVMTGHGGDELFGGYARYLDMLGADLQANMDSDLALARERLVAEQRMAERMGKDLLTPFLSPEFVEAVRALPLDLKVSGGVRKVALRMMARELGLSEAIAGQKKKAAQYGSGIMKLLKDETKRMGMEGVQGLIKALCERG
jgi:asparagine synthase (glutamine-hydrolysing)